MKLYYIADCTSCLDRPLPFEDTSKRDEWAQHHTKATGHTVETRTEVQ